MTKVHPKTMYPVADMNPMVFTVWKKSLLFNCDGYTMLDSNGNLVFRVDNYVAGGNREIVLMDVSGRPIFTIRRKRVSLSNSWHVYDGETTLVPRFFVTKHANLFNTKAFTYVGKAESSKNNNSRLPMYQINGSYVQRCCVVYDVMQRNVAKIRSKEAKGGTVALGVDVFRLVAQPLINPADAMALVIVLDQMFGSSRHVF